MCNDEVAYATAQEIADTIGWTLGERVYSVADTECAAGWELEGRDVDGLRLAVNVEYEPVGILESGALDSPRHILYLHRVKGLGWLQSTGHGPTLSSVDLPR